jgi:hypothetical protein
MTDMLLLFTVLLSISYLCFILLAALYFALRVIHSCLPVRQLRGIVYLGEYLLCVVCEVFQLPVPFSM